MNLECAGGGSVWPLFFLMTGSRYSEMAWWRFLWSVR